MIPRPSDPPRHIAGVRDEDLRDSHNHIRNGRRRLRRAALELGGDVYGPRADPVEHHHPLYERCAQMTRRDHLHASNRAIGRAARHWLAHRLVSAEKWMIRARLHRELFRAGRG